MYLQSIYDIYNNNKYLKNFKILSLAGAYWHEDAKNKQLARIYGTCSINKEELKKYLNLLEERKKNDHKKFGKELDLLISSKYSHGSIFWLPKGIILIEELKKFYVKKHIKNNYLFVKTKFYFQKNYVLTAVIGTIIKIISIQQKLKIKNML